MGRIAKQTHAHSPARSVSNHVVSQIRADQIVVVIHIVAVVSELRV